MSLTRELPPPARFDAEREQAESSSGHDRDLAAGSAHPRSRLADVDALFKGFADPTRLRLLSALVAGPLCVSDLVDILNLPQPLVSRHLAYLRRVGLATAERETKFAHYRLAPPTSAVHANLLACVRSCFVGIESLDAERAAAAARARPQ